MPLLIVHNDITTMHVDAIVNAANNSLLGGGDVDGAIHKAAGPSLLEECRKLNGCETGSAKITGAGDLPCKYVIHTVGPVWYGGSRGEEELLTSCYKASLDLAISKDVESLAFPLISSGIYGYPKDKALEVAVSTIKEFLLDHDMTVYIVIFDRDSYTIDSSLYQGINDYISSKTRPLFGSANAMAGAAASAPAPKHKLFRPTRKNEAMEAARACFEDEACVAMEEYSLNSRIEQMDESFSEMLLRKIDESGMTDAECYKKANIDRKLFSKIRSDKYYKTSKPTVIAFAVALRLSLDETREMLSKAGFALSHSSKFDIIIEYFIENGNYDVFEINEALFAFDQPLLA